MTDIGATTRDLLERVGALQNGHFVLASGLHSDRYCQCARLFEHPDLAGRAALWASELIGEHDAQLVLAPGLGGILWGYELARALGLPSMFAERVGDRSFALRRGFAIEPGTRVLLAEDVVTTGGSVMELVPLVRDAGAEVVGIVSVVDRSGGAFDPGVPYHALTALEFKTYAPEECPMCAAGIPLEKPGSKQRSSAS